MTNEIVAKTLLRLGPTEGGEQCSLSFEKEDGSKGSLVFPSEQVQPLLEFLIQLERQVAAPSADDQPAKRVLYVDDLAVAIEPEDQTILLDIRVEKMCFAFSLPKEQSAKFADLLQKKLPSN